MCYHAESSRNVRKPLKINCDCQKQAVVFLLKTVDNNTLKDYNIYKNIDFQKILESSRHFGSIILNFKRKLVVPYSI